MKKGELGKCRGMFGDMVVRRLYRLTYGSVACSVVLDRAISSILRNPKAKPPGNGGKIFYLQKKTKTLHIFFSLV